MERWTSDRIQINQTYNDSIADVRRSEGTYNWGTPGGAADAIAALERQRREALSVADERFSICSQAERDERDRVFKEQQAAYQAKLQAEADVRQRAMDEQDRSFKEQQLKSKAGWDQTRAESKARHEADMAKIKADGERFRENLRERAGERLLEGARDRFERSTGNTTRVPGEWAVEQSREYADRLNDAGETASPLGRVGARGVERLGERIDGLLNGRPEPEDLPPPYRSSDGASGYGGRYELPTFDTSASALAQAQADLQRMRQAEAERLAAVHEQGTMREWLRFARVLGGMAGPKPAAPSGSVADFADLLGTSGSNAAKPARVTSGDFADLLDGVPRSAPPAAASSDDFDDLRSEAIPAAPAATPHQGFDDLLK